MFAFILIVTAIATGPHDTSTAERSAGRPDVLTPIATLDRESGADRILTIDNTAPAAPGGACGHIVLTPAFDRGADTGASTTPGLYRIVVQAPQTESPAPDTAPKRLQLAGLAMMLAGLGVWWRVRHL